MTIDQTIADIKERVKPLLSNDRYALGEPVLESVITGAYYAGQEQGIRDVIALAKPEITLSDAGARA